MRIAAEFLSKAIGGVSIMLIAIAVGLLTASEANAQTGLGCTNAGGGAIACAGFDSDGDGRLDACTLATDGKNCDAAVLACTCGATAVNPCACK